MCQPIHRIIAAFGGAIVLLALGAVLVAVFPPAIQRIAQQRLELSTPVSFGFHAFANRSSKSNIYQTYRIFHCENPWDVIYNGAAPSMVEKGPYTYLTTQWRDVGNISWKANGTIEFTYHETYQFVPEMSNGTETDNITTADLGVIGALYRSQGDADAFDVMKYLVGPNRTVFVNLTVFQLLYGYENEFLKDLLLPPQDAYITLFTNDDPTTFRAPSAVWSGGPAATSLPQPPLNSRFQMTMWEGMSVLPYWGSSYANMINGTDGSFYPTGLTPQTMVHVFIDSMYRSFRMHCFDDSISYQDVPLYRYTLSSDDMLSMDLNPNNAAFGMTTTGFFTSPPSLGRPIWFSKPRYLDANTTDVRVTISPPPPPGDYRLLYDSIQDVEPILGLLFSVNKRIQLNTFLNASYNTQGEGASQVNTWFPILWLDESMVMEDTLVDEFKNEVLLPLKLVKGFGIAGLVLGALCALGGFVAAVRMARAAMQQQVSTSADDAAVATGGAVAAGTVVAMPPGSPSGTAGERQKLLVQ